MRAWIQLKQVTCRNMDTTFLESDTAATIFFTAHCCAATIQGWLLFKGGYYSRAAFISLESLQTSMTG